VYLSTLLAYVRALGGDPLLQAVFPDEEPIAITRDESADTLQSAAANVDAAVLGHLAAALLAQGVYGDPRPSYTRSSAPAGAREPHSALCHRPSAARHGVYSPALPGPLRRGAQIGPRAPSSWPSVWLRLPCSSGPWPQCTTAPMAPRVLP